MGATPIVLLGVAAFIYLYSRRPQRSPVGGVSPPPGPKPVPILGNIFDLTATELWLKAEQWAREYGPIYSLSVLTQPLVFLSSPQVVSDLLDSRGAIYSDKPKMVMAGELCGCEDMVAFTRYGAQSRRQRRLMGMAFAKDRIPAYWPLIEKENAGFLQRLVQAQSDSNTEMSAPDRQRDYISQVRRYAGQLTLSVVYGYSVKSVTDPFLALAEEGVNILSNEIASGGGIWLVDLFPALKNIPKSFEWLPFMGFLAKARVWKEKIRDLVDRPYEWVKREMKNGTHQPSFCSTLLADSDVVSSEPQITRDTSLDTSVSSSPTSEKLPSFTPTVSPSILSLKSSSLSEFEHDLKWTANSMYSASGDTTVTSFALFLMAMLENPDVIPKARAELDAVTGLGEDDTGRTARLPRFEDRWIEQVVDGKVVRKPRMPYVEAVMNEVWRWGAPVPLNLPHRLMQDDIYQPPTPAPTASNPNPTPPAPILLKKGSLVFGNIWAILRNEELFGKDANSFNPDRYLLTPHEQSILYSPAPSATETPAAREEYDRLKKEKRLRDPRSYVFGFGRRQCPGQNLVESSVWLLIATILSTLDIKRPTEVVEVDVEGSGMKRREERVVVEEVKFENSIFRTPSLFRVDIRPRSERALEVIMQDA